MNEERLSLLKPSSVIMHPGPLNRGVEIDDVAADSQQSLILAQVANGVPMRMAVLEAALGDRR
jgi:aspartate carbamoyltransferase catalytic subunit